ncbi:MAG: MerR family transcriptional regulator [Bifidobacteriaceae bacterium]|jgi:DNA-binding transcriptional MerR regulator|nr:MerR family transcriptional regulator [Bifidobacteriaceae bacterium]
MNTMSIAQQSLPHVAGSGAEGPEPLEFSVRQAAEIAGVTVRAIRHYHQIGLLDEPARNGQGLLYSTEHVLRLLRIRRLTAMGLSLDETADVLVNPGSPKAARILTELDRALADRASEIQSQRRIIKEMRDTHAPVDVLPEFARYAAATRRLARASADQANQMITEVIANLGDDGGADALSRLLSQAMDDPWSGRLANLEERLREIGPDSGEAAIAALAQDYGHLLIDFYDGYAEASPSTACRSGYELTPEVLSNLVGTASNGAQRDVLTRATTALAAHAAYGAARAG